MPKLPIRHPQVELDLESLLDCKVEIVTEEFLSPEIADRVKADLTPL